MSNALYTQARALALSLLTQNGASRALYRFSNTLNPVLGTVTLTAIGQNLKSVVLPASKGTIEAFDIRLTEELIRGDIRYVLAAGSGSTFTPAALDVFSYSSKYWVLLGCTPLDPDGSGSIIYKMGMKSTALSAGQITAIGNVTL